MLRRFKYVSWTVIAIALLTIASVQANAGTVSGELIKWHTVVVDFPGPLHDEMDNSPNPFLDYRLQVTFTAPSGNTYVIPGFFDGDGQGGSTGQAWRVRFSPDEAGTWTYTASFRSGTNVAVDLAPGAGTPASFDGDNGNFVVAALDPNADGFMKYGRLESIGEHYFKFRDGGYWIKGGMDSPENFLGFEGFDNTPNAKHDFIPHINDWQPGDPDWDSPDTPSVSEDGRGIIGALNYLASQNLNSIYFMPMNIGADGKDVWPFADPNINNNGSPSNDNVHYDISKLTQWYTALDHAQRNDIFLHFVLSDREPNNKNELDNATLGVERKLFYRELIARFGHFNALQWNISEEYNLALPLDPNTIKEFAQYINDADPYDHPVTVHNHGNTYIQALGPFVGDTRFGVFSIQTWQRPDDISLAIEHFRTESAEAGHIVPASVDESIGLDQLSPDVYRKRAIWDAMLSGGSHELFVRNQDSNLDNFRAYETHYEYMWIARKFVLDHLPFWEMEPSDNLVSGENGIHGGAEAFAKDGEVYAVYLPSADQTATLSVGATIGTLEQRWFNPRSGQFEGAPIQVEAEFTLDLGAPPSDPNEDWVVLVTVVDTVSTVYQQDPGGQGLLSMEAEENNGTIAQGGHSWELVMPGGASGTGAMEAQPNNGTLRNSNYVTQSPRMDFQINFVESGTHYVWIRGLGDGNSAGVNDSVHVGLNGGAVNTSDRITGFPSTWTWSRTTMDGGSPAVIDIPSPGVHTINVWMREDGLIVDKIVMTTDNGLDPTTFGAEGPPASPRGLPVLPEPVISPDAGAYFGSVDVTITSDAENDVYFTTDGSAPTTSSTLYTGSFTLTADATVQAIATRTGYNDSGIASASYTISNTLLPPTIDPAGGTYLGSVIVSITDTAGAAIHYTTDGSVPTDQSPLYTVPFVLMEDATVRAIAVLPGFTDSPEASESYIVETIGGGSGLFLQSNAGQGIVSVEAENYSTLTPRGNHTWEPVTPGGQSGLAAMESTPNTGATLNGNYAATSPQLDFEIEFIETGTHYVWVRGLGDSNTASVNDSVHIGLDGQEINTSDRLTGFNTSWSWSKNTMDGGSVAQFQVATPGVHTLNVWMREDGLIVDKIVLTTDPALIPTNFGATGPAESPRGAPTLAAPVISPEGGAYFGSVDVTISAEPGATIYYETDGSVPTTASNLYVGSFNLASDAMVRAFAVQSGFNDSPVSGADYTISNTLLPPIISPESGSYLGSVTVTMTENSGAAIHFTTDDTAPTSASPVYSGPFVLTSDATVRAITVLSGFTDSPEASANYTITTGGGGGDLFLQSTAGQGIVSMETENFLQNTPQGNHFWTLTSAPGQSGLGVMEATPNLGQAVNSNYSNNSPRLDFDVEFVETGTHYVWIRGLGDSDSASRNDSVHAGLNGEEIKTSDRMTGFNSSLTWSKSTMDGPAASFNVDSTGVHTVNVWMREDGLIIDKIVLTTDASFDPTSIAPEGPPESPTGTPTLAAPVISPNGGAYFGAVDVTITAEPGATIYYETDGSMPTTSSNLYVGTFNLASDAMVRAFAVQGGFNDSPVASADYTISTTLLPPTISPPGQTYLDSVEVTMTETAGASIHYTLDDTAPTSASPLYTGPFTLTESATVRAITVLSGFTDSPEAVEVYTISPVTGGGGLFQQSLAGQGVVSLEAENFNSNIAQGNHMWEIALPGGQSGLGAMQANPNTGTLINTDYALNSPRLDFIVEFFETGTHYVWVRGIGDSNSFGTNDSVHIGLDGEEINTSDRITVFNSNWTWTRSTLDGSNARLEVDSAGIHTVNLWMREDGIIVDKIVLTTDPDFNPTAISLEGPPESTRVPGVWPEPVLHPMGGTFSTDLTVSITASGTNTIHFTTDGSAPTTASPVYSGPFTINADTTVRAITVGAGLDPSASAQGSYVQTACNDTRIMAVGDSITLGRDSFSQPPPGTRTSYRRDLFFSLVEAGYNVDFVGNMDDGQNAIPAFDSQHEGHGGETDNFVANNIFNWLVSNPADYILLHIGTNGLTASADDIDDILDEVDRFDPNIHVVVAKIINQRNFNPTVSAFNANIDALVTTRIGNGDLLSVVDMENTLSYPDDLVDNLHPTATGFSKMADTWFIDLNSRLPACAGQ
ncbi:MAG: chitobiase/beta-hexosaminidase C-terminal domain-containing protein [Pseudomonadota bacterium]